MASKGDERGLLQLDLGHGQLQCLRGGRQPARGGCQGLGTRWLLHPGAHVLGGAPSSHFAAAHARIRGIFACFRVRFEAFSHAFEPQVALFELLACGLHGPEGALEISHAAPADGQPVRLPSGRWKRKVA